MSLNITTTGGTGSRFALVVVILAGVASLIASLISFLFVSKPPYQHLI